jgi:arylsulfatase A-like enzyme
MKKRWLHVVRIFMMISLILTVSLTLSMNTHDQYNGSVQASSDLSNADLEHDRPNIIVIVTDDQRYDELDFMPIVKERLKYGVTFTNAFVSTPLCCPSRASFFTGQYAHNHGVLTNGMPLGGASKFNDTSTLAVWLKDAGYTTALVGKYMNDYGALASKVPTGWDVWYANLSGNYYNYSIVENGVKHPYGDSEQDYLTDVLSEKATSFVKSAERPFFLWFAPAAPHLDKSIKPEMTPPAPRHVGTCSDLAWNKPPSFNEGDVSDKPSWVRRLLSLDQDKMQYLNEMRENRICSLKAVDESVGAIIDALGNEIQNTLVIFTSDNGFVLGEHRHVKKTCIYEECVKVPLIIYYPRMNTNSRVIDNLVLNIDIPVTISEIAHVVPDLKMDGMSLLPLIEGSDEWRDSILLEYWNPIGNYVSAVRTEQFKYVKLWNGERELYDLMNDRYELNNLVSDNTYSTVREELAELLQRLETDQSQTDRLTVSIDKLRVGPEEVIKLGGTVPMIENTRLRIEIFDPTNSPYTIIHAAPNADGTYAFEFVFPKSATAGLYTAKVTYGEQSVQRMLELRGEEGAGEGVRVEIDGHVFNLKASLSNGHIQSIEVNPDFVSIIVSINTGDDDGEMVITLPRELIDARIEADDAFIVLVDGDEVESEEVETTGTERTLKIQIPANAQEIEIIGTKIIPEFGMLAVITLTVALGIAVAIRKQMKTSL